jgi:MoaA/NifB/PqqE/SkfB family radical SAM enzyme
MKDLVDIIDESLLYDPIRELDEYDASTCPICEGEKYERMCGFCGRVYVCDCGCDNKKCPAYEAIADE